MDCPVCPGFLAVCVGGPLPALAAGGAVPCCGFWFLSPSSLKKPILLTAEDTALSGLAPLRNLEENMAGSSESDSSDSSSLESTGLSESEQEPGAGGPSEAWGGAGAAGRALTAPLLLLLLLLPGLSSGSASRSDFL